MNFLICVVFSSKILLWSCFTKSFLNRVKVYLKAKLLHYFGLLSKVSASLLRNNFPKRPRVNHFILCQNYNYDAPVVFVTPSLEAVYCFICGRRLVAVSRHRMNCLVLILQQPCFWKGYLHEQNLQPIKLYGIRDIILSEVVNHYP